MSTILSKQFHLLQHIINQSESILLVAHTRPDPDTMGAVVALADYLQIFKKKHVAIVCYDLFPSLFAKWSQKYNIQRPDKIDISQYDLLIGCDNIDHGFNYVMKKSQQSQITIGIDHHLDLQLTPDIALVDSSASSTCEILYDFFVTMGVKISYEMATALTIGILGDTRLFHNPNTSAHVINSVANMMDCGVDLSDIIAHKFTAQTSDMLKLWGKALMSAQCVGPDGAIVTAITHNDLQQIKMSSADLKEGIKEISSLLCTIVNAPFAMILFQLDVHTIKGSLRTEEDRNIDTSYIAGLFGGGGHKLASGFEIQGKLIKSHFGWQVV